MTESGRFDSPVVILLIEDNPSHAELIMRSLGDHRTQNQIYHVSDGEVALDYLFRRNDFADPADSPTPQVILLDLRLPKVDGLEVLRRVKQSADLSAIPVVILTTSEAERDVTMAYELHANSYLVKPVVFSKFIQLMDQLGFYWLNWNHTQRI